MTTEPLPFDGGETPYIDNGINEQTLSAGENGLTDKRYEVIAATIHYGLGALVRDCEDTPGALQDDVQPMVQELLAAYEYESYMHQTMEFASRVNAERGNEFEAAYDQALETIATLKEALRNIHLTASKSTGVDHDAAIDWIEGEASRVLKATLEPLA